MPANRIHLAGAFRLLEGVANGAITPGMLLQQTVTGTGANAKAQFEVHQTSGGVAERIFALEDALQGRTVADAYALNDPVQAAAEMPGSLVNALLLTGNHYTIGEKLMSNGDGTLTAQTSTNETIAWATEDLDLTLSNTNQIDSLVTVDSTGSGTFVLTIEGVSTAAITYSATIGTLITNINNALNTAFGTSAIVASGGSLAALILTFSGTGYTNRVVGPAQATLLAGSTGYTMNGSGTIGVPSTLPITTPGVTGSPNTLSKVRVAN